MKVDFLDFQEVTVIIMGLITVSVRMVVGGPQPIPMLLQHGGATCTLIMHI
jgi:hypothetical protein